MDLNNEEYKVRSRDDLIRLFPHYMALPIQGFKNPSFHTFVTSDSLPGLLKNSDAYGKVMTHLAGGYATYKSATILKSSLDTIFKDVKEEPKEEETSTPGWNAIAFVKKLLFEITLASMALKRLGYLKMYHFYGLQGEYGGFGFTEFVDNKISSVRASDFHTVLTPYEYIMYRHLVHAVDDGEVVEIINDKPDVCKYNTNIRFNNFSPDKLDPYMGNRIVIKHTSVISSTYANIQKDSFFVKVGDKVKRGQAICRVGCSGTFRSPFLLFGLGTKPSQIWGIKDVRIPFDAIPKLWDNHFACNLLEVDNFYGKKTNRLLERFDNRKINYTPTGSFLRDLSFVKQYKTIQVE